MLFTALDLFVTTKCTLRCKYCLMGIPYVSNPEHTPKDELIQDITHFFNICAAGWQEDGPLFKEMTVCSGEALLHPNLVEILEELLKHKKFYQEIHLSTNCTVRPSSRLIELVKRSDQAGMPIIFILNDYGPLSTRLQELVRYFDSENIKYVLHKYWGDNQYFGGWVDLTPRSEAISEDIAFKQYSECRFTTRDVAGCVVIHKGRFFPCSIIAMLELMGLPADKIIGPDILWLDKYKSHSEKLEAYNFITMDYRKRAEPFTACSYCAGFSLEHCVRIPAAEQV